MRLLEQQAKKLLTGFGLRFSEAKLAYAPVEAGKIAAEWGGPVVIKAQVPFGGRGKVGAVKFADGVQETENAARQLIGHELCGHTVTCISIEPRIAFVRELYVGITWDTAAKLPVSILSAAGGIAVEDSRVQRRTFDPRTGLSAYEGRELAAVAGVTGKTLAALGNVFQKLAVAFLALDAVVAEINPLVETSNGDLLGLDARIEIEDDAMFRQKELLGAFGQLAGASTGRTPTPLEMEAQRIDEMDHRGVAGRMVEFDGDLALLIGGGGASLTVFDAIRRYGGRPANYCEIGGNPTETKVAALTALLLSKPGTRKLAVIMNVVNNTRADLIAQGVLMGLEKVKRSPAETLVVFRVPGSWEQEARTQLANVGVNALGREVSLDGAAKLAVERMNHAA